jgi:CRP-like cAMP-binding protein
MEATFPTAAFHPQREDILAILPVSTVVEYRKGQIIYGPGQPSTSIYLRVAGTVRLSHITDDGYELVLEIIRAGEVFGESGFVNVARVSERATAHGDVMLMIWRVSAIEDLMTKHPRLAVSLL